MGVTGLDVLSALADAGERLNDWALSFTHDPRVKKHMRSVDLRHMRSGPTVELSVFVELPDGRGLDWVLDLTWDSTRWGIRTYVGYNAPGMDGSETLYEFADEAGTRDASLAIALRRCVEQLLSLSLDEALALALAPRPAAPATRPDRGPLPLASGSVDTDRDRRDGKG